MNPPPAQPYAKPTAAFSKRQMEIIHAAGRLLTNVGVSGLTTKNLAIEMQFSESAIYRHFPSKEAIIIGLLNHLASTMDDHLTATLDKVDSPKAQFTALFQQQLDFFATHPYFMVAVFSDGLMEESQAINQAIFQIMSVKMKHLRPIILKGQEEGVFSNEISVDQLILVVMGSFRLQMYRWRIANFEFDIVQAGRKTIQSLLLLIQSKP